MVKAVLDQIPAFVFQPISAVTACQLSNIWSQKESDSLNLFDIFCEVNSELTYWSRDAHSNSCPHHLFYSTPDIHTAEKVKYAQTFTTCGLPRSADSAYIASDSGPDWTPALLLCTHLSSAFFPLCIPTVLPSSVLCRRFSNLPLPASPPPPPLPSPTP